ncbi:MAG: glutamate--tRNA ligase [Coriobacteriia bacterium]|nr:glutamate--tRNA ligase [Coriobacteriia bacterium]
MSQVRVRFAPSPTGELHLGGARTAIYNWAFARNNDGVFMLRIEDTDPERSTPENTAQILRSMRWLGLDWDEGPEIGGAFGPYFQTERFDNYVAALEKLKDNGSVYPCFCTPDELTAKREAARKTGGYSGYDRTCRTLSLEDARRRIDAGEPHVWRLAIPLDQEDITINDLVHGETVFPLTALDDYIVARTDGTPTYNFAASVDDTDMQITHVIRGDDHMSNTPKQALTIQALGAPLPQYAHLPMIWGPDGKKLSKRHGATSVEAYRDEGIVPEALLNYLALLGWSLDGETTVIDADTLTENFSMDRISKNPAIFDTAKLEWLNGVYLRDMEPAEFAPYMVEALAKEGLSDVGDYEQRTEWFHELAPLVNERIKLTTEIVPMIGFLFVDEVQIDESARAKVLDKEGAREAVAAAREALADIEWDLPSIESALQALPAQLDAKPRLVFQPLRVALTGTTISPPLFESMLLLGKEKTLKRLDATL